MKKNPNQPPAKGTKNLKLHCPGCGLMAWTGTNPDYEWGTMPMLDRLMYEALGRAVCRACGHKGLTMRGDGGNAA